MDETGLWELFSKTGLPEAFPALAGSRAEQGSAAGPWGCPPPGPGSPNSLRDVLKPAVHIGGASHAPAKPRPLFCGRPPTRSRIRS